jgi:hypothetical protein
MRFLVFLIIALHIVASVCTKKGMKFVILSGLEVALRGSKPGGRHQGYFKRWAPAFERRVKNMNLKRDYPSMSSLPLNDYRLIDTSDRDFFQLIVNEPLKEVVVNARLWWDEDLSREEHTALSRTGQVPNFDNLTKAAVDSWMAKYSPENYRWFVSGESFGGFMVEVVARLYPNVTAVQFQPITLSQMIPKPLPNLKAVYSEGSRMFRSAATTRIILPPPTIQLRTNFYFEEVFVAWDNGGIKEDL